MIKDQLNIFSSKVDYSEFELLKSIKNDSYGLVIEMADEEEQKSLKVSFESPIAYRATDVRFLDKLWSEIDDNISGKVMYTCSNSSFIEYVRESSLQINLELNIRHFVIHNDSYVLDILSVEDPIIKTS